MQRLTAHRSAILYAITTLAVAVLLAHGPIAQDQTYHHFADRRTIFGIANLWNVATNLPFLMVGCYGLVLIVRRPFSGVLEQLRTPYLVFFIGLIVLAPASAWYHIAPDNATLLWDRLPISLVFMALFAAIFGEHVDPRLARRSLPVLLLLGMGSLLWWRLTGDLSLYVLVQFLPLLLVPVILLLYPSPLPERHLLWAMLAVYAVAKAFELFDAPVYDAIGISGHSLKHLVAAVGVSLIALRLRRCTSRR